MADSIMFNVPQGFDFNLFIQRLSDKYRAEGFTVNVANFNGSVVMSFDKGTGGINMLLGMGEGIKATIMLQNGTMSINFSDGDWTGKIIGLVVGWFLCLIPFITAIIGCVKQSSLPKKIGNDATMIAASCGVNNPYNNGYNYPNGNYNNPANNNFNNNNNA